MGAKNFLPRFNTTGGSHPDIGSNTLTVHGEGTVGQGMNTTGRWGTVYATEGNFIGNLSIGQPEASGGSTSTTKQITFGDDFYMGQSGSASYLYIGTGIDSSAGRVIRVTTNSVNITSSLYVDTLVSSPTIQISKNGASWASADDGTWAEIGNGVYTVRLSDQDTSDLGWLILRVVKSGTSAEQQVFCAIGTSPDDDRENYNRIRRMQRSI